MIISQGDGSNVAVLKIGEPCLQSYTQWIIVYGDGWKKVSTAWRLEREMHCSVAYWTRQTASRTISKSCKSQPALFTIEQQHVLRPAVAFSKTCFKHKSM
jgi:hypothetical protein